jgi:hypothetical protein
MEIPTPPQAVAALATFLRERLAEVSDTLGPLWARRDSAEVVAAARQFALVVVGAAAPFATTSYSRARLIRQMHASGLLSDEHALRTEQILALGSSDDLYGAPR